MPFRPFAFHTLKASSNTRVRVLLACRPFINDVVVVVVVGVVDCLLASSPLKDKFNLSD